MDGAGISVPDPPSYLMISGDKPATVSNQIEAPQVTAISCLICLDTGHEAPGDAAPGLPPVVSRTSELSFEHALPQQGLG